MNPYVHHQQKSLNLGFIIVSGTIGEETAVKAMKAGAYDYLMKDRLQRLGPAVARALQDAAYRKKHRSAVAALRESEKRLAMALDGGELGTWDRHLDTGEVIYNQRWAEMVGHRLEELEPTAYTWEHLLHPDDKAMVLARLHAKRTEEELRRQKERLQTILDNIPTMVAFLDDKGNHTWVNQAWEKTLGWSLAEIRGRDMLAEFYPDSAYRKQVIDFITRTDGSWGDFRTRSRSGEILDTVWTNVILSDGTNIGIGYDVTARKKIEQQLVQSQKMESIGTLAGGIAHDFNNILASILINTELALMDADETDPVHHSLEQIYSSCLRAGELVRQILAFSRQEVGEPKVIHLIPVLDETLKLLRATLPKSLHIEQECDVAIDTVFADPVQIEQVIINLSTNGAHAMREHGGVLRILLEQVEDPGEVARNRELDATRSYLKLRVSDTGEGIDPEALPRIFEPYFTTKRPEEGSGLGLAVAHGIIQHHGGAIEVRSETGAGSTFTIYLPVCTDRVETKEPITHRAVQGTERILVVDDEESLLSAYATMLANLGYRVTTSINGQDALERFRRQPERFDLVITDQTMPFMNGDVLAQHLLSIRPDIPIILCTGFSDRVDEQKAKEMGIKAFVMKPVITQEFAGCIRSVLEGSAGCAQDDKEDD